MLLAGHITRSILGELVGLDTAGAVGEVILTLGNLTDQVVPDMRDLTIGVVAVLVARVILKGCIFCSVALAAVGNAGNTVEIIILILDHRVVAILHFRERTVVILFGVILVHILGQHGVSDIDLRLAAQCVILKGIGHIVGSRIVNIVLHASQQATGLVIGVLIAELAGAIRGLDLHNTAQGIMFIIHSLSLGISDAGGDTLVFIHLASHRLAAGVGLLVNIVAIVLELSSAAGNGSNIANGTRSIRTGSVAEVIVSEITIRTQRRMGFQHQMLFLLFFSIAVGEGAALGVTGCGVLDHVVTIVILRLLDTTIQLNGTLAIALSIIHVVGTEGFGVQVQTSEVSMVHLTVHVQGESNLGVVVGCNNAAACKLPAILAVIEVDAAAQIPVAARSEIHSQGAVNNTGFIHLLGKGLTPATSGEAVTRITVAAEILVQRDVTIVTACHARCLEGTQEFRGQLTINIICHRQILDRNVAAVTIANHPARGNGTAGGCMGEVAILQHIEMIAGQTFLKLHAINPEVTVGGRTNSLAVDGGIRRLR